VTLIGGLDNASTMRAAHYGGARLRPGSPPAASVLFQRDAWRCADCGWEPEIVRLFREVGLGLASVQTVLAELREAFARSQRHLHADHQIPIAERPDLRLGSRKSQDAM
jgi:hypothetical protein